jgi:acetolactate synthase-1/3 small subunit
MNQEYTITVFSENKIGLLSRLTTQFNRRKLNIESLTVSESAIKGVFKFTIVTHTDKHAVEVLTKQLEKQVDVIRAFYLEESEVLYQEVALYKIETSALLEANEVEGIIRSHHARILEMTKEYTIIEKTGHKNETQELFDKLKPFGVLQFVRSGRVAITRSPKELLSSYLKNLDEIQKQAV